MDAKRAEEASRLHYTYQALPNLHGLILRQTVTDKHGVPKEVELFIPTEQAHLVAEQILDALDLLEGRALRPSAR